MVSRSYGGGASAQPAPRAVEGELEEERGAPAVARVDDEAAREAPLVVRRAVVAAGEEGAEGGHVVRVARRRQRGVGRSASRE